MGELKLFILYIFLFVSNKKWLEERDKGWGPSELRNQVNLINDETKE